MSTAKTDITVDTSGIKMGLGNVHGSLRTALDDVRDAIRLGLVAVSDDATHLGTLEEVLLEGTGISFSTLNSGANETRQISAVTDGIDVDATGGEALSVRDMVYLDESDGKWYQQDIDATSPIKMGRIRGCVIESGGIAQDESGKVRVWGEVDGFTSLTAGATIYASTTAGGYTQTKPFVTSAGTQKIVSEMGYALSTTVVFVDPAQLSYHKQGTLSNGATLSLSHHVDNTPYERDVSVFDNNISGQDSLTSHTEENQDAGHPIQGPNGASSGILSKDNLGFTQSTLMTVGTAGSGENVAISYRLNMASGMLTQLAFYLGSNTGSPTGTITWEIRSGTSTLPSSTVVASGTFTPVPSSINTIDVPEGVFLNAGHHHFVLKSTSVQSAGNYWKWWKNGTDGSTANYGSLDGGTTWALTDAKDMLMLVTLIDSSDKTKLAQSFQISSAANIGNVRLYLRKFGSPTGDLTVKIVNDDTGSPDETPSVEATSYTVAASSLTTSWAWYDFEFEIPPSLSGSTTYWIVLETTDSQSDTDYVSWGFHFDTPDYADGEFQQYEGAWAATTTGDAIFDVIDEGDIFISQALLDDWSSALATYLMRLDDGSGSNPTTQTTVKNSTGSEKTIELTVIFERGNHD